MDGVAAAVCPDHITRARRRQRGTLEEGKGNAHVCQHIPAIRDAPSLHGAWGAQEGGQGGQRNDHLTQARRDCHPCRRHLVDPDGGEPCSVAAPAEEKPATAAPRISDPKDKLKEARSLLVQGEFDAAERMAREAGVTPNNAAPTTTPPSALSRTSTRPGAIRTPCWPPAVPPSSAMS